MGTLKFNGVRFQVFANDHLPTHVHGRYAGAEVVLDLYETHVDLSKRSRNVLPANGKASDVAHILDQAGENLEMLLALWRSMEDARKS